jgi:4-carboxymuconolactone decarboxylase
MPDAASLTTEQSHCVAALTNGPRKGVVGPYIPLLQCPRLLNLIEPLGSELRFHGRLDPRVREIVICAVARHTSNQFEWNVHASLAFDAGVSRASISSVLEGRIHVASPQDERIALEFTESLTCSSYVSDSLFGQAKAIFGDEGIIELTTLIGYFVTISWIMNVAQTKSDDVPKFGLVNP